MRFSVQLSVSAGVIFAALTAFQVPAALAQEYTLTIKDHKFDPPTLEIPARQRVQVTVVNADPTPEEFESNEFHVEKIVNGNSQIRVFVGPLGPGEYNFFGEFNLDTAQGTLIVK